jgi:hypothetical protein
VRLSIVGSSSLTAEPQPASKAAANSQASGERKLPLQSLIIFIAPGSWAAR